MTDLLWVYSHVWNEGTMPGHTTSMIGYFLRHYLSFADRVILYAAEDISDDTLDIARAFGERVEIVPFLAELNDTQFVLQGSRIVSTAQAVYAMWPDADEFLRSRGDIRAELEAHAVANHRILRAGRGYQMMSDDWPTTASIWNGVTLGQREDSAAKPVIVKPSVRLFWTPGKHSISDPHAPIVSDDHWDYCHFRFLGESYHLERNARNWARIPEAERAKGHGYHTAPANAANELAEVRRRRLLARDIND